MRSAYPMDLFRDCIPEEETHNIEKSHKCNQCEYASTQGFNLKRHLMKYSGEKSHKCNRCEYASSQSSNLKTHMGHFPQDGENEQNLSFLFFF